MSAISETPPPQRLGLVQWLIVIVATIGFAFDTYALLTTPLIARPALAQLLPADPADARDAR